MNNHTDIFEAIPLPPELDAAVERGLRRGRAIRLTRRAASGLAAAFALVFLMANIPALSAGASRLPVVGRLVQVLQVGSGGREARGLTLSALAEGDGLRLTFTDADGLPAEIPTFSAVRRQGPHRLVLRLHGLAEPDAAAVAEELQRCPAVAEAYPLASTDGGEAGLTAVLAPGWDWALGRQEGPALFLAFFPADRPAAEGYTLASAPMAFGPELAELTESLLWEGATQLRLPDGSWQVVVGQYSTPERAQAAREGLKAHRNIDLNITPYD